LILGLVLRVTVLLLLLLLLLMRLVRRHRLLMKLLANRMLAAVLMHPSCFRDKKKQLARGRFFGLIEEMNRLISLLMPFSQLVGVFEGMLLMQVTTLDSLTEQY